MRGVTAAVGLHCKKKRILHHLLSSFVFLYLTVLTLSLSLYYQRGAFTLCACVCVSVKKKKRESQSCVHSGVLQHHSLSLSLSFLLKASTASRETVIEGKAFALSTPYCVTYRLVRFFLCVVV